MYLTIRREMQQKYHRNNSRFEKHMLMHVFRARECIDILTHKYYLVLHLFINNSLYGFKIKLFKLNPFIKPPIDCEREQTTQ